MGFKSTFIGMVIVSRGGQKILGFDHRLQPLLIMALTMVVSQVLRYTAL
jgi:hypothetical protein